MNLQISKTYSGVSGREAAARRAEGKPLFSMDGDDVQHYLELKLAGLGIDQAWASKAAKYAMDSAAMDDPQGGVLKDSGEVVGNTIDRLVPAYRQQLTISLYHWRTDPPRILGEMKPEAALVTDPVPVDLVIHSGADAEYLCAPLLMPNIHRDVTPGAAQPAYRRNLCNQIPWPRGKAIVPACQCPYRTEVDHVSRVSVIQAATREEADLRSIASPEHAQLRRPRHILAKSDTARTQNAPLRVEDDKWTDRLVLDPMDLRFDKTAFPWTEPERVVLKRTLSALIADGAIERVVQQQKLQHRIPGLLHAFGGREHLHPIRNGGGARDDQLWGSVYLHLAHPTTAHHAELRMIAKMRNLAAGLQNRLEN